MKNAILIVLGAFFFMALPGVVVWYSIGPGQRSNQKSSETVAERNEAIDDAFGSRRSSKPDPENAGIDNSQETAAPSDDETGERELTKIDRDNIEELFLTMGKAARDDDGRTLANLFSVTLMVATAEENGLVRIPIGMRRSAFVKAFEIGWRQGIGQWSESLRFDELDIRRVDPLGQDRAIAYVRLWDDQLQIYTKMRWWAVQTKSKGWKFYDFEDFETNLRVSTIIGVALAGVNDGATWMPELTEGLQLVQSFTNSLAETGQLENAIAIEEYYREFLKHQLPTEIECFSRIVLCAGVIGQLRFEDGLEELQLLEDVPDSKGTPGLHYMRGNCLAQLDRHEEALASFEKYIDFLGADGDVLGPVSDSQLALGEHEAAIDSARRGLEDSPYSLGCFGSLASALPADRLGELDPFAKKMRSPQEAWEVGINYALEWENYTHAAAIFAVYEEKFPDSEWLEHYGVDEDLGSGIDVTKWSLDDWLDDESVREKIEDHYARRERFSNHLGELDAQQVDQLINYLATAEAPYTARYFLEAQEGDTVIAAVVKALDDERFVQSFRAETYLDSGEFEDRYPVSSLIHILSDTMPAESKPALAKLLSNEAAAVRASAGYMLAAFGNASHVDAIAKALNDPEQEVRNRVLSGLQRAKRQETLQPELSESVVPLIADRIRSGEECHSEIWALNHLDEELSLEVLREPDVLRVDHPSLSTILWALSGTETKIAENTLEEFLSVHLKSADQPAKDTEPDASYIEYPSADVFEAALMLLRDSNPDAAKGWADRTIDHDTASVRNAAADTLLDVSGLAGFDHYDLSDESSNPKVKALMDNDNLVYWLIDEVAESGFSYYFSITDPEGIMSTVAALEKLGAPQSRDLLQRAIDQLNPKGLPQDSEKLGELLAEMTEEDEKAFSALEKEWSMDPDQLYVLRIRRLLENRDLLIGEASKLGLLDEED